MVVETMSTGWKPVVLTAKLRSVIRTSVSSTKVHSTHIRYATLYFTKQLPHRVLHWYNYHWVNSKFDLSQLVDWVSRSMCVLNIIAATRSRLLDLILTFHLIPRLPYIVGILRFGTVVSILFLDDLLLQADGLCRVGIHFFYSVYC